MTHDLEALRTEFANQRVGSQLYAFLAQIVKVTVASYPPSIYSPSGIWDPATLMDLLHDWLEQRLLRGHLEVLLSTASSTSIAPASGVVSAGADFKSSESRSSMSASATTRAINADLPVPALPVTTSRLSS
jgi:hypothetical protein